ncbi:MAG: endonuclease/exonuclease/phosphatase family protein [Armatimonadota bacterium]
MTLNLRGFRGDWPTRRDRIIQVMHDEEIDVILLQEVAEQGWRTNQALEISMMTGYAVAFVPAHRYFPWPSVATGLGILSRFPLSNQFANEIYPPTGFLPIGNGQRRILQRVEANLSGLSVVLCNTHFPAERKARLTASHHLWSQLLQEEAVLVVVGGDFHADPDEECLNFLQGKTMLDGQRGELVDAWITAGIGPAATYPSNAPEKRVDYLLYQAEPSVIVQETKVIGQSPAEMSDHAAVVATFSISPTRDPQMPFEEEPVASLEPTGGGKMGGL